MAAYSRNTKACRSCGLYPEATLRAVLRARRQPPMCALWSLEEDPKCFNTWRADEPPEPRTFEVGSAFEVKSGFSQVIDAESVDQWPAPAFRNAP
jgi:hypothetical protein